MKYLLKIISEVNYFSMGLKNSSLTIVVNAIRVRANELNIRIYTYSQ